MATRATCFDRMRRIDCTRTSGNCQASQSLVNRCIIATYILHTYTVQEVSTYFPDLTSVQQKMGFKCFEKRFFCKASKRTSCRISVKLHKDLLHVATRGNVLSMSRPIDTPFNTIPMSILGYQHFQFSRTHCPIRSVISWPFIYTAVSFSVKAVPRNFNASRM